MSLRELSLRALQTFWRGIRQKEIIDQRKGEWRRGYQTLEASGPVEASGRSQVKKPCLNVQPRGHPRSNTSRRFSVNGPCTAPRSKANDVITQVQSPSGPAASSGGGGSGVPAASLQTSFSSVRRALVDNVLRRVTNSQAAQLRRKAAHELSTLGNSAPFLALIGVSLASGTGIITKEDEVEGVCHEIRQAVTKSSLFIEENNPTMDNRCLNITLKDLELGEPIAKGCSAVVYSAKLRRQPEENIVNPEDPVAEQQHHGDQDGSCGGKVKSKEFPLAIKMMFNYHAESNAFVILRAMQRETVPAQSVCLPDQLADDPLLGRGEFGHLAPGSSRRLPAHPNIVEMWTVFADQVPSVPGDKELYGEALPRRINPDGYGRNMSLFLLMRRYDCSLRDYMSKFGDEVTSRTSLTLLTQLLEGIAFLAAQHVSHRDLKSDNILLDLTGGVQYPRLVITDFGCCLADRNLRLRLPYRTFDTDKGGNSALMAPEVASAVPGTFTYIDYSKADLWTAGTLAYEIFGLANPFYAAKGARALRDSRTYLQEELPPFPESVPVLVKRLVNSMLAPNPAKRPTPRQAATICQLLLWAPSHWYREPAIRINRQEILQWLLTIATKVICESRWRNSQSALQEYQLVATFLATHSFPEIRASLDWIQDELEE